MVALQPWKQMSVWRQCTARHTALCRFVHFFAETIKFSHRVSPPASRIERPCASAPWERCLTFRGSRFVSQQLIHRKLHNPPPCPRRQFWGRKPPGAWHLNTRRERTSPLAETIGVVLDGDAPSAPAGIPTCRHTAFFRRASWRFPERRSHCGASLIRYFFRLPVFLLWWRMGMSISERRLAVWSQQT